MSELRKHAAEAGVSAAAAEDADDSDDPRASLVALVVAASAAASVAEAAAAAVPEAAAAAAPAPEEEEAVRVCTRSLVSSASSIRKPHRTVSSSLARCPSTGSLGTTLAPGRV
jgi:hypothetical protein